MGKRIVWRTDARSFKAGDTMASAGDHLATLNGAHAQTEHLVRAAMANDIRKESLYTWEDEQWARRTWHLEKLTKKQKHFYKLEIDEADIRHRGDVNHYSDIGEALKAGSSTDDAVDDYIAGRDSDRAKHSKARFEVLVAKATVLERHDP